MNHHRNVTLTLAMALLASPALLWSPEVTPAPESAPAVTAAATAPATAARARRAVVGTAQPPRPAIAPVAAATSAASFCVVLPGAPPSRVVAVLLDGDSGYAEHARAFTVDDATVRIDGDAAVQGGWVVTAGGVVGRFGPPHRERARGWWLSRRPAAGGALAQQLRGPLQQMPGAATARLQVGLPDRDGQPRWVTIARSPCAPGVPPAFEVGGLARLPHRVVLEGPDKSWAAIRVGG